ncbi:MAG: hypothetical protein ACPL3C_13005, partial [Pyrobaculum sp.]
AEMWEAWLHAVFNPPYAERSPRRPPRKPPLLYTERRRDKPVEEPVAMAKYARTIGARHTGSFACAATASFSQDTALNAHTDKPPPRRGAEGVNSMCGDTPDGVWAGI